MISSVLGQVTGQLDKRFLLNAFFPTLFFSLVVALVVVSGTGGVTGAAESWEAQSAVVRVLTVVGWAAGTLVAANLVSNGALWIIQLFEGYAIPLALLRRLGQRYQLRRARLASADKIQVQFPVNKPVADLTWEDMAPTSLGNVLLSAESYSARRYGCPAVRIWPRFYGILPEATRTSLDEARSSMEFLLVIAFFATVFTVPASVYLMSIESNIAWTLLTLVGSAFVATIAYRGAHTPAELYGDQIRAAFDLHRRELLVSLGVPPPATLQEERRIWGEVIRFLDRGDSPGWRYKYRP